MGNSKLSIKRIGVYSVVFLTLMIIISLIIKTKIEENILFVFVSATIALLLTIIAYKRVNLRDLYSMYQHIMNNKKMLLRLSLNDFKTRFAGSTFGTVWAFVQPATTILVFWFVFQVGLRSRPMEDIPFILWLISGLIPWFYFSDVWGSTTNVFLEYSYLVKKVVFNIDILPIVKLISNIFVHLFFLGIMVIIYSIYGYYPEVRMIEVLYYLLCMIALVLAMGFITSSVQVFFRDMTQIVGIIMQVLMWMTPIMWPSSMLPSSILWILKINPMFYIVQGYRHAMIGGAMDAPSIQYTAYFWLLVSTLLLVGISFFQKLKPHFADVL